MSHAEVWIEDTIKRVTGVQCVVCERLFFVLPDVHRLPRRCCYCGTRFRWDKDEANATQTSHGFRVIKHDADHSDNSK